MQYCKRCVYPFIAVNLNTDAEGVCSACRVAEQFAKLDETFWAKRKKLFEDTIEKIIKKKQGD